jgi:hypothetical protein
MTTDPLPGRPARTRRRLAVALLSALVAVALAGLAFAVGGGDGDGTAAADRPAAPTSAPPSAPASVTEAAAPWTPAPPPPTPQPTGPTSVADEPPPSRPAVALHEQAAAGDGITASITSVESIQGTGTGRGDVAGPALRVHVRIDNGTAAPVSLDGVTVSLASGAELTPASPLDDPSQAPFAGTVAPGDHAEGVYVFSLAETARGSVTVSVGYQAGAPIMVFTGSAS